jgi:hypothetical protein
VAYLKVNLIEGGEKQTLTGRRFVHARPYVSHVHATSTRYFASATRACSIRSHSMSSCLAARHHVFRTIRSLTDLSIELSILHNAKQSRSIVTGRRRNVSSYTRAYSSSARTSNDSLGKRASSSKHEVSALLHKISAFLPRTLPGSTTDRGIQSSQLWSELLSEADADLCSPSEAHPSARVVGECSVCLFMFMYPTKLPLYSMRN